MRVSLIHVWSSTSYKEEMRIPVAHVKSVVRASHEAAVADMVPGTVSAHVLVVLRHRGTSMMKGSRAFACCLSHPSSMMRGFLCAHPASAARVRWT